jgi:competence protein ComEC
MYSAGIVTGAYAWRPAAWWVVGAGAFMAAGAYFALRRSGPAWLLGLGTLFFVGALHIQLRSALPRLDTSILPYADHREVQVTAHVTAEGRIQRGGAGELRQSLDVESEQILTADGQIAPVHSGIRINIYIPWADAETPEQPGVTSFAPAFRYGDRIRFVTNLKPARNFRNPGSFDYQGYLADRGIAVLGSTKIGEVEHLPGFVGTRAEHLRSRMHRSVIAKLHELWPARHAVLIDAMVIGDEAFIDRDTRADFQRSGTYHILVVSGMNVSILAFVVFWTFRRLRLGEVAATVLTVFRLRRLCIYH